MSEEFLRKYESGEEFEQTIGEALEPGADLFEDVAGKREHNIRRREQRGDGDGAREASTPQDTSSGGEA